MSGLLFASATPVAALVIGLFSGNDEPVANRLRIMLRSSKVFDWITWFVGGILFIAVVHVLAWIGAAVAVISATIAAFVGRAIQQQVIDQGRGAAVDEVEAVLKELRLSGVEEEKVRCPIARGLRSPMAGVV
ncbi:MAG: hypothetical protein R3B96_22235 [Pirellulaceae bacterium]